MPEDPPLATEVEQDGKRFMLHSAPRPAASLALRAVGVALSPTVRQVAARRAMRSMR
jgi:hypothetical protein